jgi:uncharacterized protein (DUF2141 family)
MFKYVLFILLVFSVTAFGKTHAESNITVHVRIEGFKNEKGLCYLLLFESKKGFPESREHAAIILKDRITNKSAEFELDIRSGIYAISILHDENLNERFDKTWYGRPVEGFGISNNPSVGFGPPTFQESSISLEDDNDFLKIEMIYL